MFIRGFQKTFGNLRDEGKEALINVEAVDYFNVEYDDCIYAHTKYGEKYFVSYYASRKYDDGETTFDKLCKAIRDDGPMFGGIDVTDEEMEERLKKRDKGELAKEEIKAHE